MKEINLAEILKKRFPNVEQLDWYVPVCASMSEAIREALKIAAKEAKMMIRDYDLQMVEKNFISVNVEGGSANVDPDSITSVILYVK